MRNTSNQHEPVQSISVLTAADSRPHMQRLGESVDPELKDRPQWVVWKYVKKPGVEKPTKVPFNPSRAGTADTTRPETWGTFTQAVDRAQADPRYAGIGFVFSEQDPYCGIDLDHCVTESGRTASDYAQNVIQSANSYTELSPSGTGVHIIVSARLPGKGRKTAAVEMYDQGRYFTFTGQVIDGRNRVARSQEYVDRLYQSLKPQRETNLDVSKARQAIGPEIADDKVIDAICATKHGSRFVALYAGYYENKFSSRSEADLALIGIIATYVGNNPSQIDRLFRASKLYRDKWDEQRGDMTYGERTITKAMEG